jgi:hypothetical protein
MAQIMTQGDSLNQMIVQFQHQRNGAGDLRHLQDMGKARPVMIAGWGQKDLGFMFQPPEGLGVNYTIPVPLKGGTDIAFLLPALSPSAVFAQTGIWRKELRLMRLHFKAKIFSYHRTTKFPVC